MSASVLQETINANLVRIRECIARACSEVGRDVNEVTLVGVSKTHPVEAIRAAYAVGVRHFGENRVKEFEEKISFLREMKANWHFIGHLQSNKALRAVKIFNSIDSVNSIDLALKLDRSVEAAGRLPVLLEVRMDQVPTK